MPRAGRELFLHFLAFRGRNFQIGLALMLRPIRTALPQWRRWLDSQGVFHVIQRTFLAAGTPIHDEYFHLFPPPVSNFLRVNTVFLNVPAMIHEDVFIPVNQGAGSDSHTGVKYRGEAYRL